MSAIEVTLLVLAAAISAVIGATIAVIVHRRDKRKREGMYMPDNVVLPPERITDPWSESYGAPGAAAGEPRPRPYPPAYVPLSPPLFDLTSCDFEAVPEHVPPAPTPPPEGSIAVDDPTVLAGASISCHTVTGAFYRLRLVDAAQRHFLMTRRWTEDGIRKTRTMKVLYCGCADGIRHYADHVVPGGRMRLYEVQPDGSAETATESLFSSRIVRCFLDVPDVARNRSA